MRPGHATIDRIKSAFGQTGKSWDINIKFYLQHHKRWKQGPSTHHVTSWGETQDKLFINLLTKREQKQQIVVDCTSMKHDV